MNFLEEIKKAFKKIKDYFVNMPKDKRKKLAIIGGIVVVFVVVLTLVINLNGSAYRVLYTNIEASEANNIYQSLIDAGIKAKMNENGEVTVPRSEYNTSLIKMASEGYPNSSLPYSIFASHSGLTSTESENKQWLIYQLQDRIQDTLKSMDGILGATVTISIDESSDYVWQQTTDTNGTTAGVLLTFKNGTYITEEQVAAIKNLVASSVPQLDASRVTVVNASTREELGGDVSGTSASGFVSQTQNLEFEAMVRKQIESNIVKVLSPRYGSNGVVATATVTINYDKMITESVELVPKNTDGDGYSTHFEENWSLNQGTVAGDIVGEENNTDIPTYAYNDGENGSPMTDYSSSGDYDYSTIKKQIEKGNAVLEKATVAVLVDEKNLTEARRLELIDIISASADIAPELISVASFYTTNEIAPEETLPAWMTLPTWIYIAVGAGLFLIIIVIIIVSSAAKKAKKRKKVRKEAVEMGYDPNASAEEIESYKRELANAAMAGVDPKDDAILDEVRDFARDNPEITANLLRSWLKEGE